MTQFSVKTLILLLLAVLFISLLAQVRIELPLNEAGIPITGQTFAVLLVGALMGRKLGPLAVLGLFVWLCGGGFCSGDVGRLGLGKKL